MSIVDDHLLLSPERAGSLLTPEEFDAADIADQCYAYELIHRVLVVTPPPSEGERGQNDLLGQLLRTADSERRSRSSSFPPVAAAAIATTWPNATSTAKPASLSTGSSIDSAAR